MNCVKNITDDIFWIGGNDRRLALFENVFPVPNGISYNSYLVTDEKTVLLDTVDKSVSGRFFENIAFVLGERTLDYVVINHMEPDHCAALDELIRRYTEVKVVCSKKAADLVKQFFELDIDSRAVIVNDGDKLETGRHTFRFFTAPMVHWPEVTVTFDETDGVLFSADAFGTFGALNGNVFADEFDFEHEMLSEARRYYTNIVGKYGVQVQALLKKAAALDVKLLCPLHGPVWRSNIGYIVEKYNRWSIYAPEENGVLIAYGSIYGNTENAAEILAVRLSDNGVKNIAMYDVSVTHPSYIVSDAFRYSHMVFASATYNGGIFCNMETLLHDIKAHNLQNRTIGFIQNGSWAALSGKAMTEIISPLKCMTILDNTVSFKSSLKETESIYLLADEISKSVMK